MSKAEGCASVCWRRLRISHIRMWLHLAPFTAQSSINKLKTEFTTPPECVASTKRIPKASRWKLYCKWKENYFLITRKDSNVPLGDVSNNDLCPQPSSICLHHELIRTWTRTEEKLIRNYGDKPSRRQKLSLNDFSKVLLMAFSGANSLQKGDDTTQFHRFIGKKLSKAHIGMSRAQQDAHPNEINSKAMFAACSGTKPDNFRFRRRVLSFVPAFEPRSSTKPRFPPFCIPPPRAL